MKTLNSFLAWLQNPELFKPRAEKDSFKQDLSDRLVAYDILVPLEGKLVLDNKIVEKLKKYCEEKFEKAKQEPIVKKSAELIAS